MNAIDRRAMVAGAVGLGLAGCGRAASAQRAEAPALKTIAPSPVGCCVTTAKLADPAFTALLLRHFGQITAEWEMKMEAILAPDGALRFAAADKIADFARANRLRLFGTTLIWGEQKPIAFQKLDGDPRAFAKAYDSYIGAVVARYRGQAVGWDVINEPLSPQGGGLQANLWTRNLGAEGHMVRAFEVARAADPDAMLMLNDYNLENVPAKRGEFLRLAERLLNRGAPIGGLGSQSHIAPGTSPDQIIVALKDLASLGLPVHVSELDLSIGRRRTPGADVYALRRGQAARARATASAWRDLPTRQRFALTSWGLRDTDSWLRGVGDGTDEPLLFDGAGRAKASFWAMAEVFSA